MEGRVDLGTAVSVQPESKAVVFAKTQNLLLRGFYAGTSRAGKESRQQGPQINFPAFDPPPNSETRRRPAPPHPEISLNYVQTEASYSSTYIQRLRSLQCRQHASTNYYTHTVHTQYNIRNICGYAGNDLGLIHIDRAVPYNKIPSHCMPACVSVNRQRVLIR